MTTKIRTRTGKGLSSFQLKCIALVFMTVDHVGAFAFELPAVAQHYDLLRTLGRIAAPIFLYTTAESVRHTSSRTRYLLRLYLAAVLTGLFTAATNFLFRDSVGEFWPGNIFFTYFYTAFYITVLDRLFRAARDRDPKTVVLCLLGIAATVLVHIAAESVPLRSRLGKQLFESFIVSPLCADYSILFIALGVLFYFTKRKPLQMLVFVSFCLLSGSIRIGQSDFIDRTLRASVFFGYPQYWMILALPFLLFYNGSRGRKTKLFFYAYYPLHRYLIILLAFFCRQT